MKAPFKFIIDDWPIKCMRFMHARYPHPEEFLGEEFHLVPCEAPEGLPPRDNGKYWVRQGKGQKALLYHFIIGRWWSYPKGDIYGGSELAPQHAFSERELASLRWLVRNHRNWISKQARKALAEYDNQHDLRRIDLRGQKALLRFKKMTQGPRVASAA